MVEALPATGGGRHSRTLWVLSTVGRRRVVRLYRRVPDHLVLHDDRRLGARLHLVLSLRQLRSWTARGGREVPRVCCRFTRRIAVAAGIFRAGCRRFGPATESRGRMGQSLARTGAARDSAGARRILAGYRR